MCVCVCVYLPQGAQPASAPAEPEAAPAPSDWETTLQTQTHKQLRDLTRQTNAPVTAADQDALRSFDVQVSSILHVSRRNSELDPKAVVAVVLGCYVELGLLDTYEHVSGLQRWSCPALVQDVLLNTVLVRPEWAFLHNKCLPELKRRQIVYYGKQLLSISNMFDSSNVRTALHMLDNDLHQYRFVIQEAAHAEQYTEHPDVLSTMLQLMGTGNLLRLRFTRKEVRECESVRESVCLIAWIEWGE